MRSFPIFPLLISIIILCGVSQSKGQNQVNNSKNYIKFAKDANDANQKISRFYDLANDKKGNRRTLRYWAQLKDILIESSAFCKKVASTKGKMTKPEFLLYQRELQKFNMQLTTFGKKWEWSENCMEKCDKSNKRLDFSRLLCKANYLVVYCSP